MAGQVGTAAVPTKGCALRDAARNWSTRVIDLIRYGRCRDNACHVYRHEGRARGRHSSVPYIGTKPNLPRSRFAALSRRGERWGIDQRETLPGVRGRLCAAVACDERSRAVLLHMACAWLRLAEWAERDGDTDPEQL
jgi:hypothetical protein